MRPSFRQSFLSVVLFVGMMICYAPSTQPVYASPSQLSTQPIGITPQNIPAGFKFPFLPGSEWRITNGIDNHQFDWNWNAVDFVPVGRSCQGESVLTTAPGIIEQIDTDSYGAHRVFVDHENGFHSSYVHLASRSPLNVGDRVWYGTEVGKCGNTGNSYGAHIHFQVCQGECGRTNGVVPIPIDGITDVSRLLSNQSGFFSSNLPYAGQYIAQSYYDTMTTDSIQIVQIQLRNIGAATWDNNTKIAPVPHDQPSPFYDPATWIDAGRIMAAGSIAPGQTKVFQFGLRAPSTPGQHIIAFGFVQEGVTWFSEPSDGFIHFQINVTPEYRGQYVGQNYRPVISINSTQTVQVRVKNIGLTMWDSNTKIAPVPRDQPSPFYDPATWIDAGRIMAAGSIAPGQTKVFQFGLRAPSTPGRYRIAFGFVQEGVMWFREPAEAEIHFDIDVVPNYPIYLPLVSR